MKIVKLFSIFHEPKAPWSFNGNFLSYASKCIMWRILGLVYQLHIAVVHGHKKYSWIERECCHLSPPTLPRAMGISPNQTDKL